MKRSHILIVLLVLAAVPLRSQIDRLNYRDYRPHVLIDWINDKASDPVPRPANGHTAPRFEEANISQTHAIRESELHATINPNDPNNKIVAYRYKDTLDQTISGLYYTLDNGNSWHRPTAFDPLPAEPYGRIGPGGDPVVAFDDTGKAYFTWMLTYSQPGNDAIELSDTLTHTIQWAESTDGGQHWTRHATDTLSKGTFAFTETELAIVDGQFTDKEWIATVPSTAANAHDLLAVYASISVPDASTLTLKCRVKKANSNAFEAAESAITTPLIDAIINDDIAYKQFPSLCTNRFGDIIVGFLANAFTTNPFSDTPGIYFSRSTDNGSTFSPPALVSRFVQYDNRGADSAFLAAQNLNRIASNMQITSDRSAESPHRDNIYMVWNAIGTDGDAGNGIDIYFTKSTDLGLTWSAVIRVHNDDPGLPISQFLPSIYVTPNGTIVIGYYDRRRATDGLSTDYYFSISTDGGNTFNDYRVNAAPSRLSADLVGGFGVGDYVQLLADDDYIYPIWPDGRTNDGDLDIFFARIPMNNPTSTESIRLLNGSTPAIGQPYPNPTTGRFAIDGDFSELDDLIVHVFDVAGARQDVVVSPASETRMTVDLGGLEAGLYFVVFFVEGDVVYVEGVVRG